MISKLRLRSLAVAAAAIACTAVVPLAFATHSWGGYHWARTTSSFTLKVGDNLTSGWKPYLGTTTSDWSKSTKVDMSVVAGGSNRRCSATLGRVEVCNGTYGNNGWLGLASISLSGGHISQGTVKVNDTYFSQSQYNNSTEKNHVMCQEVGHTIGLGHTSEDGSTQNTCMDYSQSTTSQHPNQHDYDELGIIYAHLDSSSTVGSVINSVIPAMADLDSSNRASWGRLVSVSKDGKQAVYELDFGNNNKQVTFVYFANAHAAEDAEISRE